MIYSYAYGIMFSWEKICLQLIKMIFHMVEDMCTLCSIIWSGVRNTEKGIKRRNRRGMQKDAAGSGRRVSVSDPGNGSHAGSYPHACGLPAAVLYFRYDQDHEGNLARQMFLLHPELKKELWGGHLWNPSYCAVTVSDRSREQVSAYIEGQKEKERESPEYRIIPKRLFLRKGGRRCGQYPAMVWRYENRISRSVRQWRSIVRQSVT